MDAPSANSLKKLNPVRRTAIVWWVLCLLLLAGVFAPFVLDAVGIQVGDWAFALMVLCFIFGVTSIVVAVMYSKRARLLDRMLNRENLLAYWKLTPDQWSKYVEEDYRADKRDKRRLLMVTVGVCVLVGAILAVVYPDKWLLSLAGALFIILLMGVLGWLAVWLRHRRNRKGVGEVYLGRDGVYINRELHVWNGFGARLEAVQYLAESEVKMIEISYSVPSHRSRAYASVRIPVPPDRVSSVPEIVAQLRAIASA